MARRSAARLGLTAPYRADYHGDAYFDGMDKRIKRAPTPSTTRAATTLPKATRITVTIGSGVTSYTGRTAP